MDCGKVIVASNAALPVIETPTWLGGGKYKIIHNIKSVHSGTYGGSETSLNAVACENIRVYYRKQKTIQVGLLRRHLAANSPPMPEIPKWRESVVAPSAHLSSRGEMGVERLPAPKRSPLSRRRPVVAIPGKGVRCQWGQFGMRASPYAPPNIDQGILCMSMRTFSWNFLKFFFLKITLILYFYKSYKFIKIS